MCLLSSQQDKACAELRRNRDGWQVELALTRIPLALLRPWTPPDLELSYNFV